MPVLSITSPTQPDRPILVEVDVVAPVTRGQYGDVRDGSVAGGVIEKARDVFGEGLDLARACAIRVADTLGQIAAESRPEEFTLQLAIKLDTQVGAVIAKASAGAQLQVQMKWKCAPAAPAAPAAPPAQAGAAAGAHG